MDRCVLWAEQFSDDDSLMNSEDIVQIFYSQRQMKDKELKEAHIKSLNRSVAHNEELRRKASEEEQRQEKIEEQKRIEEQERLLDEESEEKEQRLKKKRRYRRCKRKLEF